MNPQADALATAIVPVGLAVDSAGVLHISDALGNRVVKLVSGSLVTVAGNGTNESSGDGGLATAAGLKDPTSIVFDSFGNLLIADRAAGVIRKVSPSGVISRAAGTGVAKFAGDGGPGVQALFNLPQSVAVDASGNLYIADTLNHRIRMRSTADVISTIAGTGIADWDGDGGPALRAELQHPASVAVDASGNIYVAQRIEAVVRKITPAGVITTIAGNGRGGFSGDGGPAIRAALDTATAVEVDAAGNVYVADAGNNRIRKIDPHGIITTVAGSQANYGLGDGGPAIYAVLQLKKDVNHGGGLALDSQGNLYIADTFNHRIRKVSPSGVITTVAGIGTAGYSGDGGPAMNAALNAPLGLAIDQHGNLFIADQQNHRIRRVSPDGMITTVAGNGRRDFGGDGRSGQRASLRSPSDVAVDRAGNLYIADQYNNRIRVILATRPTLQVDGPADIRLNGRSGSVASQPQTIMVRSNVPGLLFSTTGTQGTDWLRLNPAAGGTPRLLEISATPANLAPGTYKATVTISAPDANPTSRTVNVTFDVGEAPAPALAVDKADMSFTLPRTAVPKSELLTVSNSGGGALEFNVEASTLTGGNWLKASLTKGSATPARGEVIVVTADPTGLSPGTFTGRITITAADGTTRTVPVTLTVSEFETGLHLSQSGLSFVAVANGGVVPPQIFGILNTGNGAIDWDITTSTLSGGPDWLRTSRAMGRTGAGSGPTVEVSVNPAGLSPGTYYGLIRVEYGADDEPAANSPQFVTVFLEVLAPGSDPGAIIQPAELLFTGVENGPYPASKEILIYSLAGAPKSYRSVISDGDDAFSLSAPPRDGTVSPGQPARIIVQPRLDNLLTSGDRSALEIKPGVYKRNLSFQFSDGRVQTVPVTLIVAPADVSSTKSDPSVRNQVGQCAPKVLVPAMTSLPQSFSVSAGWPVALSVEVSDDCGTAMDRGFVSVNFSNGDSPVLLTSLRRGRWQGSWVTRSNARTPVTLRIEAVDPDLGLRGSREVNGDFRSAQEPPVFTKEGVVSFASPSAFTPVAPGGIISILGDRLAEIEARSDLVPVPTELGGTEVVIAGRSVPLLAVGQKRIDAIVPVDVNVNTSQQILVRRGVTLSRPVSLDVAPAQPAILRLDDRPQIFVGGGEPVLVSAENPAKKDQPLVIRATGLGLTDPLVREGLAGPQDPAAATRDSVTVTVGGLPAQVESARLMPGVIGIYEVALSLPEGLEAGNEVPVVLSVSGQVSSPATIAVQ